MIFSLFTLNVLHHQKNALVFLQNSYMSLLGYPFCPKFVFQEFTMACHINNEANLDHSPYLSLAREISAQISEHNF